MVTVDFSLTSTVPIVVAIETSTAIINVHIILANCSGNPRNCSAMHASLMILHIKSHASMQHRSVVPKNEVTNVPLMLIDEFLLSCMRYQRIN